MTLFWLLAAGLIALALAFVLPTLLKQQAPERPKPGPGQGNLAILREQRAQLDAELAAGDMSAQQHAVAHAELQKRVLEEEDTAAGTRPRQPSRLGAVLLALAIPALALPLYGLLGNPQALLPQGAAAAQENGDVAVAEIEAMVERMAQRLDDAPAGQPGDPQAWEMLARSYAALQRFPEASRAYARAVQLAPGDSRLLADHADLLAIVSGGSVEGEPLRLVERALAMDPNNLKALALAGTAAYGRKDFAAAQAYWRKAEGLAPAGSGFAQYLARSLAEARQAAGNGAPVVVGTGASTTAGSAAAPTLQATSPAAGGTIQGLVQLAPELAARVAPGDTVFILARAPQGPRMPLAILRHQASELPIRFVLDDSSAMASELRLSGFPQVVLDARISRSGQALPQSGDLFGHAGPLATGGAAVTLTIDSVRP